MDKQIRKAKKQQTMLWRKFDKDIFFVAQILLGFSVLSTVIDLILNYYFLDIIKSILAKDTIKVLLALLISIIGALILREIEKQQCNIEPYGPVNQFAGLYSIEGSEPIKINVDNGLISRECEIIHLNELVNKFLNNCSGKRAICIIGKSGSGKSTIINLLENINKEDKHQSSILQNININYKPYNFTDKYDFFEQYLQDKLAKNYVEFLKDSSDSFLIILDQFERFFDLDSEKRDSISDIIHKISFKNVVFLFSLREEFYLPFQIEFNINDICNKSVYERKGIIEYNNKEIEDNYNFQNILICINDEIDFDSIGNLNNKMKNLCDNAFKRNSDIIFNNFKDYTLIQKQIIFNLLKNEENRGTDLNIYINSEDNEIMKQYFDVQLCSTEDYFDATRIMYLLSVGRLNNIKFTLSNIEDALCIFDKKQNSKLNNCILQLYKLQLIKKVKYNNDNEYEIAHDYIALAFEAYTNSELKIEIKAALDTYRLDYIKSIENNSIENFKRKTQYFFQLYNKKRGTICFVFCVYLLSFVLFILNFIQDNTLNIVPFLQSLVSINYVYHYYSKINRYYRKRYIINKILYMIAVFFGALGSFFDTSWLLCFGIGNSVNAISSVIIALDKKIPFSGMILHRDYGYKTFVMGMLLIFLNLGLKNQYEIVKVVAMSFLLGYSYLSHMNQEYFYTRLMPLIYYRKDKEV